MANININDILKNGFGNSLNGRFSINNLRPAISAASTLGSGLLSNGYSTDVGNIMQTAGQVASAIPGPWGLAISAGLQLGGAFANRGWGWKANKDNINRVQSNIDALKSFDSNAGSWDGLQANMNSMPGVMTFNNRFIGRNGWFNHKADKKANQLRNDLTLASTLAQAAINNNANNIDLKQASNMDLNYAAKGGPLTMRKGIMTPFGKRFSKGGGLSAYGADWTNGLSFINEGNTHERNPYDGVQMGLDPEGVPNLVEEGEVVWNDYVFSNRLKVPKTLKEKYKLGDKDTKISYAEAVRKLQKESEERPNDPISKRTLDAILGELATTQEEKRMKTAARQHAKEYEKIAKDGGKINIDPNKRGTFTAAATEHGMGVQEFASKVLANKEDYSPAMIKKATFAKNAAGWQHGLGGNLYALGTPPWGMNTVIPFTDMEPSYRINYNSKGRLTDEEYEWYRNLNGSDRHNLLSYFYDAPWDQSYFDAEKRGINPKTGLYYHSMVDNFDDDSIDAIKRAYAARDVKTGNINYPLSDHSVLRSKASQWLLGLDKDRYNALVEAAYPDAKSKYRKQFYEGDTQDNDARLAFIDRAFTGNPRPAYNSIIPQFESWYNIRNPKPGTTPIDLSPTLPPVPNLTPTIDQASISKGIESLNNALTPTDNGTNIVDNNPGSWEENLRYAPIVGSAFSVMSDLAGWTNKPDYSSADAVLNASKGVRDVRFDPIGNYLSYTPFDRMFYLNQLNSNAAATRRYLANTSGGNRGTAMAGILAADANALNSIGKLGREAEEYNLAQRQKVAEFNRATDMFNSEGDLKAQQANQGASEIRMRAAAEAAKMRDTIDARASAAKSANLTGLFNNLGNLGIDAINRRYRDMLIRSGVYGPINERPYNFREWEEYLKQLQNTAAKGGKMKRRKRGLTI